MGEALYRCGRTASGYHQTACLSATPQMPTHSPLARSLVIVPSAASRSNRGSSKPTTGRGSPVRMATSRGEIPESWSERSPCSGGGSTSRDARSSRAAAAEGARRETEEETELLVEIGRLIGVYSRPHVGIVTIVYEAAVVGGRAEPAAESTEVRAFTPDDIPWDELAFSTAES